MPVSQSIPEPCRKGWVILKPDETPLEGDPQIPLEGPGAMRPGEDPKVRGSVPFQGPSDAEVVKRCLDGDSESFRHLVDRYQQRAFWVAYNLLGNKEEAQDATQDAFVRAYRSLDRFDVNRNFFTWFYRVVSNLAIDRLRRKAVARSVALDDVGGYLSDGEQPETSLERDETRTLVREILDSLPPKFKAVMVMRDIEGVSCKEIAPILGATHATIRWRLHRARQVFREKWERMERERSRKS